MTRMRLLRLVGAGLGLLLLAMLITLPAALARQFLPAGLEVDRLQGSLWQGQAQQVRWQGQPVLDQLRWDWQLSHLLLLRLTLDLDTLWQGQAGQARLQLSAGEAHLRQADLTLPLEPLISGLPQLADYRLRGNVRLSSQEFRWSEGEGRGELQLDWRQARSDYSGDAVMGDYRMDIKAASKGYAVKVSTLAGEVRIDGDGSGRPGAGWNVGAVIDAPLAQMPRFQSLLRRVGPPDADGKYVLRYSFK